MARTYSVDLRSRILKDHDSGVPIDDLTLHYEVSRSWLYGLLKQRRETGSITPKAQRHGCRPKLEPYEQEVRQLVADHPDATLAEFVELLKPYVSNSRVRFLAILEDNTKKRLLSPPNGIRLACRSGGLIEKRTRKLIAPNLLLTQLTKNRIIRWFFVNRSSSCTVPEKEIVSRQRSCQE